MQSPLDRPWITAIAVAFLLAAAGEATAQAGESLPTIPVDSAAETGESGVPHDDLATRLETIVVTGEKLGRSLDETTSSVRVVGAAEIEQQNDEDVYDTLRRVANATAGANGQFSLRGINSTGADSRSEFDRPTASIYVDGVALDRIGLQAGALDVFDAAQVEVLRGAQSTNQGRNALAGGIVVQSRDPTPYWDLRTRGSYADPFAYDWGIAGGGPLGADLAFRASHHQRHDDGDVRNPILDRDDWGHSGSEVSRLKLGWTPAAVDGLDVLLSFADTIEEEGSDENFEYYGDPSRTSFSNTDTFNRSEATLGSLRIGYRTGDGLQWLSTTAIQDGRQHTQLDLDETADADGLAVTISDGRTLSQELSLRFETTQWSGIVGGYAARFDSDADFRYDGMVIPINALIPGAPGAVHVDANTQIVDSQDNAALFAEVDRRLGERLVLTAGLRYDREDFELRAPFTVTRADYSTCTAELLPLPIDLCTPGIDVRAVIRAAGILPEAGDDRAATRYDAWLPKLGLRYAFTPNTTAFATWSRGYRAGGAEVLYSTGEIKEFDPEYTDNYEIGLRNRAFGGRVQIDINLFRIDWQDQQVRVRTPEGNDAYFDNAANSHLYGGELETRWRPHERLHGYASVGLTRTRFDEFPYNSDDYSGNEFTRAPRFTGSLGGSWQPRLFGIDGWRLDLGLSHTDAYYIEPNNDRRSRSDACTLLDARAGFEHRHWSLFAYGRNQLDDDYATSRLYRSPANGRDRDGQRAIYGDPLRVGVQVELRWQ